MSEPGAAHKGPGILGIPLAAIAVAALVVPAIVSVALLRLGIQNRSGASIAIGAVVGAFWLMLVFQTARSAVSDRPHKHSS